MRRLLIAALGAVLLAACGTDPPPATSSSSPTTSSASQAAPTIPEGVYRTHALTWNDLVAAIKAAGFSTEDATRVRPIFEFRKTVVFTLKLQGGQWTEFESDDGGPDQVGDLGIHTVTGDVLGMTGDSGKALQHFKRFPSWLVRSWVLCGSLLMIAGARLPTPWSLARGTDAVVRGWSASWRAPSRSVPGGAQWRGWAIAESALDTPEQQVARVS